MVRSPMDLAGHRPVYFYFRDLNPLSSMYPPACPIISAIPALSSISGHKAELRDMVNRYSAFPRFTKHISSLYLFIIYIDTSFFPPSLSKSTAHYVSGQPNNYEAACILVTNLLSFSKSLLSPQSFSALTSLAQNALSAASGTQF